MRLSVWVAESTVRIEGEKVTVGLKADESARASALALCLTPGGAALASLEGKQFYGSGSLDERDRRVNFEGIAEDGSELHLTRGYGYLYPGSL